MQQRLGAHGPSQVAGLGSLQHSTGATAGLSALNPKAPMQLPVGQGLGAAGNRATAAAAPAVAAPTAGPPTLQPHGQTGEKLLLPKLLPKLLLQAELATVRKEPGAAPETMKLTVTTVPADNAVRHRSTVRVEVGSEVMWEEGAFPDTVSSNRVD